MSEAETFRNRLVGTFCQEEEKEVGDQFFDLPVMLGPFVVDAAASTNTSNTKLWSNPFDYPMRIESVEGNYDAAVTVDGTNYAQEFLYVDDGAAGTPAQAAVRSTINTSTNIAAGIDAAFTLTKANATIAPGANVFRRVLKSGSGVVLPIHMLKMRLRRV